MLQEIKFLQNQNINLTRNIAKCAMRASSCQESPRFRALFIITN